MDVLAAPCWILGVEVHPAIHFAYHGDVERLLGMMEAGVAPPGALSRKAALALDPSEPKTAAHLLARSESYWGVSHLYLAIPSQEQVNDAAGWLFERAGVNKRNAKGYDALKYAIRQGGSMVGIAALAHGANPFDPDAKGVDALELLRRTLSESGMGGGPGRLAAARGGAGIGSSGRGPGLPRRTRESRAGERSTRM